MKKNEVVNKNEEMGEFKLKTSRLSFIWNYFIAALIIIFIVLAINGLNWKFTIRPETTGELISTITIMCLLTGVTFLIEQPEMVKFIRHYVVTVNEVIEVEGIITKRKVILPYASISEATVRISPIGRIFNYGDVFIGAFRSGSDINMKGIKNPIRIHETIQNRINLLRKGQLDFWEKAKNSKEPIGD